MILSNQYKLEFEMFSNRINKMYKHFSKWAKKQGLDCYRIYDKDLPRFPFCIEVYQKNLVVYEYKKSIQFKDISEKQFTEDTIRIISKTLNISIADIYYKVREKQSKNTQYHKISEETKRLLVKENELFFWVNLSDYLDTGLFLDHRNTREIVRKNSYKKRVLNLFAYTGSFTVYAAAGGADSTCTVDLSEKYISIAKENLEVNQLSSDKHVFICSDVMQFVHSIQPNSFDLIIFDPPTFSRSKKMLRDFDIKREHPDLINVLLKVLSKDGEILFSTNSKKFSIQNHLIAPCRIKNITKQTIPKDFKEIHTCYRIVPI